jgi:cytochrome b involved in lipid metabolism
MEGIITQLLSLILGLLTLISGFFVTSSAVQDTGNDTTENTTVAGVTIPQSILDGILPNGNSTTGTTTDIATTTGDTQDAATNNTVVVPTNTVQVNESDTTSSNNNSGSTNDVSQYTLSDVAAHSTQSDCWTAIDGKVADITNYFGKHPAGDGMLAQSCGVDSTDAFRAIAKHIPGGLTVFDEYVIGVLVDQKTTSAQTTQNTTTAQNQVQTQTQSTSTNTDTSTGTSSTATAIQDTTTNTTTAATTTNTTAATTQASQQNTSAITTPTSYDGLVQYCADQGYKIRAYTVSDVALHDTQSDCWVIVDGKVADISQYFGYYAGGDAALAGACGTNATAFFDGNTDVRRYQIGVVR